MLNSPDANKAIIPRAKWWWFGLALLLILAGWLYLRGYNTSLPYFDHVDESLRLVSAQHIVDFGTARNFLNLDAYPPGINTLIYLLLKHVKPADAHHGTMLPALRLITIATWLLAVVVIALLGSLAIHPFTGLMAAAIWIVNPWIVERAHFVLPDGYLTLFTLLSLWLAFIAFQLRRQSFNTAAVYSLMMATVFKTQAIFLSPIIVFFPIAIFLQNSSNTQKKDALHQVFWNILRIGLFLFWLLLIYPTLDAYDILHFPVNERRLGLPSIPIMLEFLQQVMLQFQPLSAWALVAMSGALLWRYRGHISSSVPVVIALSSIAWLAGSSMFPLRANQIRQFYTLGAMLTLLFACGLSGILFAANEVLSRLTALPHRPKLHSALPPALMTLLLVIALIPAFEESDALTYNFTLPDRRNHLAAYMDTSLEPGMYATIGEVHTVFFRDIGGYDGVHDFKWFPAWDHSWLPDKPIAEWRDLGVEYAIMPHAPMLEDPDIYYPNDTVLLKTYPVDPNFRGPDMVVLRLYPMQNAREGQLGSIRLLGYDINSTRLEAGEDIVIRHYWQTDGPTYTRHHVFNHLLDKDGETVTQADYIPIWDARRDTTTWDDPDEIMLGREFELSLPADLPPGDYTLITGFYDPQAGTRLTSADGADRVIIATIAVIRAEQ